MSDLLRRIVRLEERTDDAGPCLAEILMAIPRADGVIDEPCEITEEIRTMTLIDILRSIPCSSQT